MLNRYPTFCNKKIFLSYGKAIPGIPTKSTAIPTRERKSSTV
jgi:hypothetical protein